MNASERGILKTVETIWKLFCEIAGNERDGNVACVDYIDEMSREKVLAISERGAPSLLSIMNLV
jgi:hypothetical protein